MKQTKFALLAAVTLAGATLINVAGVQAADTPTVTPGSGIEATANTEGKLEAKATTTAEFNVEAGKLTLDAAPDFKFGKDKSGQTALTLSDIVNGSLVQVSNTVDKEDTKDSHQNGSELSKEKGVLQVSDYRGAKSEWSLSANLGTFTNGDSKADGEITFTDAKLGLGTITTTNKVIWNSEVAPKNSPVEGAATSTAVLGQGASTLKLSNLENIKAGQYDAAITWTLSDGKAAVAVG
ncbi:WxL domain-containing protein [Latilactobacillus sakei]|uniref:WxL domain-containing protein n=1 Tax=Latilactobacillus sakei TaxID=1599 RepID=UPI003886AA9D